MHSHAAGHAPVLDIGGEVGALVVHLPSVPESGELEACAVDRRDHRFHTGVHLRSIGGRDRAVAVYPEVREGDYEILDDRLVPIARVHVRGGEVTELRLPEV